MFYATGLRTRFCLRNVDTKRFICTFINPLYAGHSKWANIKHIKAEKDGQKAALFTRLSRQIRLAIQEGGSADPGMNSQLRYVMDEALRKNMPMSTIQNSIKKCRASKEDLKKYLVELRYKQKVFTICVVYTEKFAAFKMELAPILKKAGATFAESKHMFEDFGLIEAVLQTNLASEINFENLATNDAIESGSEDLEIVDSSKGSVNFVCNPQNINIVKKSLESKGYLIENAVHVFAPKHLIELTNEEQDAYQKFLAKLREISGLEDVYDNVGVQSG